jgi:hypothetical protein
VKLEIRSAALAHASARRGKVARREPGEKQYATEITLAQHHEWLVGDARYRESFSYAHRDVADGLRDEVARLAMGWEEPVLYRGCQCGTRLRRSDRLLIFLLKALKPELYR